MTYDKIVVNWDMLQITNGWTINKSDIDVFVVNIWLVSEEHIMFNKKVVKPKKLSCIRNKSSILRLCARFSN